MKLIGRNSLSDFIFQEGKRENKNKNKKADNLKLLTLSSISRKKLEIMSSFESWQSPLSGRYASKEMSFLFSNSTRFSTWRKLWLHLAQAEKELGLDIPQEAIDQMRANLKLDEKQMKLAAEEEKKRRHDVMAHVHTFGIVAPTAAPYIQCVNLRLEEKG